MQHSSSEPHVYDNSLKALFGYEVARILPTLLPDAEVVSEQNIEMPLLMHKLSFATTIVLFFLFQAHVVQLLPAGGKLSQDYYKGEQRCQIHSRPTLRKVNISIPTG